MCSKKSIIIWSCSEKKKIIIFFLRFVVFHVFIFVFFFLSFFLTWFGFVFVFVFDYWFTKLLIFDILTFFFHFLLFSYFILHITSHSICLLFFNTYQITILLNLFSFTLLFITKNSHYCNTSLHYCSITLLHNHIILFFFFFVFLFASLL